MNTHLRGSTAVFTILLATVAGCQSTTETSNSTTNAPVAELAGDSAASDGATMQVQPVAQYAALDTDLTAAEAELAQQAKAFRRTIAEGVATGAVAGSLIGSMLKRGGTGAGFTVGVTIGGASSAYVAALQKRYFTKEKKLEKIRDDISASNAEIAASIATMQTILNLQTAQLASVRAQQGNSQAVQAEVAEAEANLNRMRVAIDGASKWQEEYSSTRSLKLVKGELTGVDNELALLSQRIGSMRTIANTLAETI